MIIKKTLVTFFSFLFTAVLLTSFYSQISSRFETKQVDLSAFANLASNMQDLSQVPTVETVVNDNQVGTADIIKTIDKELAVKIKHAKIAVARPLVVLPKKELLAKVETKSSEDLSSFEINNRDLITLYAFEVERSDYSTFERTLLSEMKDIETDSVQSSLASTKEEHIAPIEADEVKMVQPSVAKEEAEVAIDKADDMVMFDYAEKVSNTETVKPSIDKKLYERPLSATVRQAINREIGPTPVKGIQAMNTQKTEKEKSPPEVDLNSEDNIVYDYTTRQDSQALREEMQTEALTTQVNTHETSFVLSAKEINLNTQKSTQAHAFEFVPDYDRADRMDDQTSGEIKFEYALTGELNTETGVIQSQGMIPTRVELFLGMSRGLEAPLINEEGMQKFLQKQGLSIEGNLLMVALDSNIADVDVDSKYANKFLFDKNFKSVKANEAAQYVLFAGVKTGNVLIRYLLINKEVSQKIAYVGDGELYFDAPMFASSARDTFTFTTRNLLGQKKKELVINPEAITVFNTNITAKKKALNAYEVKMPSQAAGMRKYLEFKHLNDSIFVGSNGVKDIEVPGNDFIAKVFEVAQVNSLKDRCVVQVNLSKDIRTMTANGKNRTGEMFVETSFLDKDGSFSHENAEFAEKAFIVGDMEGLFSIKFEYTDGSTEFLKSFCSDGTYIVEQL